MKDTHLEDWLQVDSLEEQTWLKYSNGLFHAQDLPQKQTVW